MAEGRDELAVHLDAADLGPACRIGVLRRERGRSGAVISFAYDEAWLARAGAFTLDPSLGLYPGTQFPARLPGIFTDAAPDRWGRTLIERREAIAARAGRRAPRSLDDWDFLVGVNDRVRMGALRLARASDGAFVDDEPLSVPPVARLRDLEHWAREAEAGMPRAGSDAERWLALLLAPGSSLGGARPKASFLAEDGTLWMAKFPSREDRREVGAWEHVATALAAAAGIAVPETRLLRLGATHRTFAARRFDRVTEDRRLYASAMTLAGRRDGEDASYLDVAQAITLAGAPATIDVDLEQLFRRVVFNVLIANRDDHLRNHGFLRTPPGWRLAPAFDLNPASDKAEHGLALDERLRVPDIDVVHQTAPLYRLSAPRARDIEAEVRNALARWRTVARAAELPSEEIEIVAAALSAR